MTDNEIIKALECHADEDIETCSFCPLSNVEGCAYKLAEFSLDLINRQKAEIERLEKTVEDMTEGCQIAIKVSENKAIKEFAERLRKDSWDGYIKTRYSMCAARVVGIIQIDKLVEEMVGDTDES